MTGSENRGEHPRSEGSLGTAANKPTLFQEYTAATMPRYIQCKWSTGPSDLPKKLILKSHCGQITGLFKTISCTVPGVFQSYSVMTCHQVDLLPSLGG
jgi:hypothetical protein